MTRLQGPGLWMLVVLATTPPVATAQTDITVRQAALAVPFGVQNGNIVLLGDQLIFVSTDDPDTSFAIARSNVDALADEGQQVVSIEVRQPVAGQQRFSFRVEEPAAVTSWFQRPATAAAASPPRAAATGRSDVVASFQAQHDHRIRSCLGQLLITRDGIAFESLSEVDDSRQWAFADIREVEQDGIYRLRIRPFVGNDYNLQLIGQGLDSEQYRNLIRQIAEARR